MLKKRPKSSGLSTPQGKPMAMSSSLNSLAASSGHASPSSPVLPHSRVKVRRSVSDRGSAATTVQSTRSTPFPSSVLSKGHRPKRRRAHPDQRSRKRRGQSSPHPHSTSGHSRPEQRVKPKEPASLRVPGVATEKNATQSHNGAEQGRPQPVSASGPSSSRSSSSKVINTMKPPKQRRRRRRAQRAGLNKGKPAATTNNVSLVPTAAHVVSATTESVSPGPLSPEPPTPLMSPITRRPGAGVLSDVSPSPQWREVARQHPHPIETLITSRYEDTVRSSIVARGSKSDSERRTPSSTVAAGPSSSAVPLPVAPLHDSLSVGSPGMLSHRFPSRPEFHLDASLGSSPMAAPSVHFDTASGANLAAPRAASVLDARDVGTAAAECLLPATAGIVFAAPPAAVQPADIVLAAVPSEVSGVFSASPAAALEMPSFPLLRSPLAGLNASGKQLSAEDRQLSAVGLRIGAQAFHPCSSSHASPAGATAGSPTTHSPSAAWRMSAPSRNVIKVVNTATGATQRHTPSSDFPRAPAPSASLSGDSVSFEEPTAARVRTPPLPHSPSGSSLLVSSGSGGKDAEVVGGERYFPSSQSFPANMSRSGSRRHSPMIAPAQPRDVRHQRVTVARLVSEESEIISQLFDAPDDDDDDDSHHHHTGSYSPNGLPDEDEDEDIVQAAWEVGSVASSAGRGPRRSCGAAYWHLDHAAAAAMGDEMTANDAHANGGSESTFYGATQGFWLSEDYDAWMAEPDDYEDIWEVNSSAYEDSLDEAQLQWLEEQMRPNDNPADFFF